MARIWFDFTTSLRSGLQANGTTRVERSLARELLAMKDRDHELRFCRSNGATLAAVPAPDLSGPAASPGPRAAPRAASYKFGRRIEQAMRLGTRALVRKITDRIQTDVFPDAGAGDVLFLAGETFGPKYDFHRLRELRRTKGIRIVALCQDVIPLTHPQFFASDAFVQRFADYVDFLLRDTDHVITISRATATELERLREERNVQTPVSIVYLGSDFVPAAVTAAPPPVAPFAGRPFVLSVSSIQSRKNFDLLYRVWRRFAEERRSDVPALAIVGRRGFGSADLLWQIAHDPLVRNSVFVLESTSDDELAALYEHCLLTLYPSFAEGWGLPIAESLACGKLCLASSTTSMPEAGQGLSLHLDPLDTIGWHDRILGLLDNPDEIRAHERRIRAEYRPRSWRDAAQDVLNVVTALPPRS